MPPVSSTSPTSLAAVPAQTRPRATSSTLIHFHFTSIGDDGFELLIGKFDLLFHFGALRLIPAFEGGVETGVGTTVFRFDVDLEILEEGVGVELSGVDTDGTSDGGFFSEDGIRSS